MDPAGAPWCDPRRGYAYAYGAGSAAEAPALKRQPPPPQQQLLPPRQDVAAVASGRVLKRSHGEVERWQQALYLRAVRQRVAAQSQVAHPPIDIGSVLAGAATARTSGSSRPPSTGFAGLSPQPSSTLSSLTTASHMETPPSHMLQRQMVAATSAPPQAVARVPAAGRSAARELVLLQELEKHLLGDDDNDDGEAEATGSACGSTVTSSAWGDTIQELNSITAAPLTSLPNNHNTASAVSIRSPSNSSSSAASSAASSSPPTSTASWRQLLSEAAAAIADGNHAAAAAHLAVLKVAANPRGDAEQRLVAMMAAALSSRIGRPPAPQHLAVLCGAEQRAACQLLHDVSPCFGLALHGANLAILDAVADQRVIHLIDFDVSVAQHIALIQALSSRRVAGTCLKVTAVADPTSPFTPALAQALPATEQRLKRHAQQAGLDFRFKTVSCVAGELEASRLGCEPGGDALVVNLAFVLSRVPDESVSPENPRDELLRGVRALCPRVVTLVEQELNANTAPLAARFADACAHYGAVLESLDATLARDSAQRAQAETALANKAANAMAREGPDRVERCEVFGKWRARFGMAGLRPVAIGQGVADRVRARLRPGFDVKLDSGRLGVGWMGRVVTVASAWR
ncbi:scarecrow-like protein 8 [Miscanthus floridulus]|uniref:scarecrow-like protein 8 n=1 Tax=Miscanthus floridulus TaxID=154761 RepID=UPI00345B2F7C